MRNTFLKLRLLCWLTMVGILVLSCASPNRGDELGKDSGDIQASSDDELTNLEAAAKSFELSGFGENSDSTTPITGTPNTDPESLGANIPDSILIAPNDKEITRAAKEMATADAAREAQLAAQNAASGADAEFDSLGADPRESRPRYSGPPRIPKIPGAALNKKGVLLNRFYFLRKGDTPKSVSQLLYGSPNEAKNLQKWNGGAWKPGKLVYYPSSSQPEDREMRSFYQERSVQPEEYQIEKGDTLFSIAKKKYGNSSSWKEIAVINGITSLGSVEPGMRIALYPADLSGYGAAAPSNNGYRRSAPQTAETTPSNMPTQPVESAPPAAYSGSNGESGITGQAPTTPATGSGFDLDFKKLVQQNLVAIVFGGGILLLALLLGALSKGRKKKPGEPSLDELGDDFPAPKRSKRK